MESSVMAALAKKGYLSDEKLGMVTPVDLVAVQTVLGNRHMFIGIRSPFFCMTLITKVVY
jgi:hypothetical protein